jgi:hypothetical protein
MHTYQVTCHIFGKGRGCFKEFEPAGKRMYAWMYATCAGGDHQNTFNNQIRLRLRPALFWARQNARTNIPSFLHSFIPSFLHSFIPSFLHSFIPSFLCYMPYPCSSRFTWMVIHVPGSLSFSLQVWVYSVIHAQTCTRTQCEYMYIYIHIHLNLHHCRTRLRTCLAQRRRIPSLPAKQNEWKGWPRIGVCVCVLLYAGLWSTCGRELSLVYIYIYIYIHLCECMYACMYKH